jgi:hypothetical protein
VTEQEIRQQYRVVKEPNWQVQKFHLGRWRTAFYCSSETSAQSAMEKQIKRAIAASKMTPDERLKDVLR